MAVGFVFAPDSLSAFRMKPFPSSGSFIHGIHTRYGLLPVTHEQGKQPIDIRIILQPATTTAEKPALPQGEYSA
jgi:hypothetical protein